jgi:hypothetical protein
MLSVDMLNVVMLSVAMPSVDMLNVIILSVTMPSVDMLNVVMLSVAMPSVDMLNVVMLSVLAPKCTKFIAPYQRQVSAFFLCFMHCGTFQSDTHNLNDSTRF